MGRGTANQRLDWGGSTVDVIAFDVVMLLVVVSFPPGLAGWCLRFGSYPSLVMGRGDGSARRAKPRIGGTYIFGPGREVNKGRGTRGEKVDMGDTTTGIAMLSRSEISRDLCGVRIRHHRQSLQCY